MKYIVSVSGGLASAHAWKRCLDAFGERSVVPVFADTKTEDDDLYRFLDELEDAFKQEIVRLKDGRDVWQVFFDEGMMGNSQVDLCSRILKRDLIWGYIKQHWEPGECCVVIGYGPEEPNRWAGFAANALPYSTLAPMCKKPHLGRQQMENICRDEWGIEIPNLYKERFHHNNCGGACIKGGHGAWAHLLQNRPETFRMWEENEERFRRETGKDVAILRSRRGGKAMPLPLSKFREAIWEKDPLLELMDWGSACDCMGTESSSEEEGET